MKRKFLCLLLAVLMLSSSLSANAVSLDTTLHNRTDNFEAKPYNGFTANGRHRHHFVAKTALQNNGFNTNTAYCIRMMTEDHRKTGSYGSSIYVAESSNLLSNGQYQDALQKEVNDLQSQYDCDGIAGNLQQKYFDEVIICLLQYEALFGIN